MLQVIALIVGIITGIAAVVCWFHALIVWAIVLGIISLVSFAVVGIDASDGIDLFT